MNYSKTYLYGNNEIKEGVYVMLKQLSETSIFKFADQVKGFKLMEKISALVLDGKNQTIYVKPDMIEDVVFKIRHKSFNFAAKFAVLDLFNSGIIQLVYNETHRLPTAIPYFKKKLSQGGFGVVINISNFANMHDDGTVHIDPTTLYVLMLSAAFSLVIDRNVAAVMPGVPELYGGLFANVVARMTNMDPLKRNKVQFIATKFFLIQLGIDEVRASEAAKKDIKYIDNYLLEQTDLLLPVDTYDNLENLVAGIKKAFPEFKGFEFGLFFDRWLRSYGELGAFAVEYVPYFYTLVVGLVANANGILNVKAVEKEATKNDKELIQTFNRLEQAVIQLAKK